MGLAANRFDFSTRASELHAHIAAWTDDARRAERRREELVGEIAALQLRLDITNDSIERTERKLAEARDELEQIAALTGKATPPPKPGKPPEREVGAANVRAAILRFQEGTVAEVAAYLRVSEKQVEPLLAKEEAAGVIRFTGRKVSRSAQWEYVEPTDPGEAFKRQQEHRERDEETVYALEVTSSSPGERYLASLPKDVRKEARKALRDGWTLLPGGDHYKLTRGDVMITISGTPRNPSEEAAALRRRLNRVGSVNVTRRGKEVPGTGKPIGSSGRPGLDKARANAGKTARRKGDGRR